MAKPYPLEQFGRAPSRFGEVGSADEQRHANVLERSELRQQMVKLIDETKRPIAQQPTLLLVERGKLLAREPDAALTGRIEPAEQVEQGAFTGAGAADDGDTLAGKELQFEIAEHLDRFRALIVAFAQVAATQDGAFGICSIHGQLTHNVALRPAACARHARPDTAWQGNSAAVPRRRPGSRRQPADGTADSR